MQTYEMVTQADADGRTYITGDMLYNRENGFHDIQGMKWSMDTFFMYPDGFNEFIHLPSWELIKSSGEHADEDECESAYDFIPTSVLDWIDEIANRWNCLPRDEKFNIVKRLVGTKNSCELITHIDKFAKYFE